MKIKSIKCVYICFSLVNSLVRFSSCASFNFVLCLCTVFVLCFKLNCVPALTLYYVDNANQISTCLDLMEFDLAEVMGPKININEEEEAAKLDLAEVTSPNDLYRKVE